MSSNFVDFSIFALVVIYYIFFRIKLKCSECKKEIKTMTFRQMGGVWIFIQGSNLIYDIGSGVSIDLFLEIFFLLPAFYLLFSKPMYFCRHCMKSILLNKEDIITH